MKIKTSTAHTVVLDDGREFVLPFNDPYDSDIITETMIVTDHSNGTTLSFLVHDDVGRSWGDLGDEVFYGWEFMVLDSQKDADALRDAVSCCKTCGYEMSDHDSEEDLDFFGCDGYMKPDWRVKLEQGRAFLFEKYEHGQVCYALQGESSMVDRQWDVSPVAGIIVADDDWGAGVDIKEMARSALERFTDWCNGHIFAVVHARYETLGEPPIDVDSCWGYIGYKDALACLKEETV